MSLEKAITDLAHEVQALAELLRAVRLAKTAAPEETPAPAPEPAKPKAAKAAAKKETPPADASAPEVSRTDVAEAMKKVYTKRGRPVVVKMLADYGAERVTEVPEDKLADLLKDFNEELAKTAK